MAELNIPTPAPVADPEALRRLGAVLAERFRQYESDRRLAELKYARNARQYLGIYDPDIELQLDKNRSRAYPKLTRVKCVSMLARLMNLLFQTSEKNWTCAPSAVPNLAQADLQALLSRLDAQARQTGQAPTDEAIEQLIRVFAAKRAKRLELEIEDQLSELGGSRTQDYVALCRKVLASGIVYGMGVLKGPFVEPQMQRKWQRNALGLLEAVQVEVLRPRFEFVSIWDYYADLSAKTLAQMDGQFQRMVMSKHQVALLKQREDFFADQIDRALEKAPQGNYRRRQFETELKAMGVQSHVTEQSRGKFEVIVWEGHVSGRELTEAGVAVPEGKQHDDVRASVWLLDDTVIRAVLDPWSELETDGEQPMFHHFVFEEDESTLLGNGLPNVMRDSQMSVCAGVRMVLDNASFACGQQREINTTLLSPGQDVTSSNPFQHYFRDDTGATAGIPAVRAIAADAHIAELQALVAMFREFADTETFVNAATGGDAQKGPSEPFRTATGASMLRGDAALPFKDVVRNFDSFTQSVIGALIAFNRNFNANPALQGDFQPVARGATSLIAKEVLGLQLDNLATTLTEEEKRYINMREFARARVRVRDLDAANIVVDDAEADRRDAQAAEQAQRQQALAEETARAEIRKILADALKAISQAGKNSATAEAATINALLAALEKGVSVEQFSQSAGRAGAAAEDLSGAGRAGAASAGEAAGGAAGAAVGDVSAGGAGGAPGGAAGGEARGFATAPA